MDTGKKGKRDLSLNVVSGRRHHGGFGAGMIDLSNLSSVIIDGDEAYIDMAAIHARSKVERRIRFTTNKDEVPNGRKCWVVWVAVDRNENDEKYFAGVAACEMLIDTEARKGWKILADHANKMDKALKGHYILEGLNETEKSALRKLLQEQPELWERSPDELKEKLA